MVSYIDDNVKNNSSKYFGRYLGRCYCRGSWWQVVVSYTGDNVKNNSPKYFGRWLLSVVMVAGGGG